MYMYVTLQSVNLMDGAKLLKVRTTRYDQLHDFAMSYKKLRSVVLQEITASYDQLRLVATRAWHLLWWRLKVRDEPKSSLPQNLQQNAWPILCLARRWFTRVGLFLNICQHNWHTNWTNKGNVRCIRTASTVQHWSMGFGFRYLWLRNTFAFVAYVSVIWREIVFSASLTSECVSDVMLGPQMACKCRLAFEYLVAQLAHELKA